MGKTFTVEIAAPKNLKEGELFEVEVEAPAVEKKPRGVLAGLTLEEMTPEQLKRETINAKSVLYKATQRGAAEETIAANQARVDAVEAEKEKRGMNIAKAKKEDAPNLEAGLEEVDIYEV